MYLADCVEAMRAMPPESVDAIVTDPPYGLEFMGKEWDSFNPYAPLTASTRVDHMNAGEFKGTGYDGKQRPQYPAKKHPKNEKCLHCGKWRVSSNRCSCADPEWEHRNRPGAPPAMLAFEAFCQEWVEETIRVLKPGGYLLAFGGTRTYHRMACAIEDAGFECRDSIHWIYGSGFNKDGYLSYKLERKLCRKVNGRDVYLDDGAPMQRVPPFRHPDADAVWHLAGAIKPAHEPIIVARKPLIGAVAENVLRYGTGALNVDACRVAAVGRLAIESKAEASVNTFGDGINGSRAAGTTDVGRWPPNVLLSHDPRCERIGTRKVKSDGHYPAARPASTTLGGPKGHVGQDNLPESYTDGEEIETWHCAPGCPVAALDAQSNVLKSGAWDGHRNTPKTQDIFGKFESREEKGAQGDTGGASRFFPQLDYSDEDFFDPDGVPFCYCAKAARKERDAGLNGARNTHPTVKPIKLMAYLVRLVTPPGGIVLDPFLGSGTTGIAAIREGFRFVGVEQDADYLAIAEARINHGCPRVTLLGPNDD